MNYSKKWYYITIALVSFFLYIQTLAFDFVLDDVAVIAQNKFVQKGFSGLSDIFLNVYWKGFTEHNTGLYRPLSLMSFAVEYQLSPDNPKIHHFVNIIIYVLVCVSLLKLLLSLFNNGNQKMIFITSLLFAVHPIHTEVVANIKSRDELFSLLFLIQALFFLLVKDRNIKNQIIGSIFLLLSLFSKESAIVLVPIVFFMNKLKYNSFVIAFKSLPLVIIISLAWLCWHYYITHKYIEPATLNITDNGLLETSDIWKQKASAFGIFLGYIIKSFYPYEMIYDYSFKHFSLLSFYNLKAITGLLLFLGIILTAIYTFIHKNKFIFFALIIIILPLMLTSNLFFLIGTTMADRFLFVSSIGSCILISFFIFQIQKILKRKIYQNIIILSLTFTYFLVSFSRSKDWEDNFSLFKKDILKTPNNARANCYVGDIFLQKSNFIGDHNSLQALKYFKKSYQIMPSYFDPINKLGNFYFEFGKFEEAKNYYTKAIKINENDILLNGNLGIVFYKLNKFDSASLYLQKAVLKGSKVPDVYSNLGSIYFNKNEHKKAIETFQRGIYHNPSNSNLYLNLGNTYGACGNFENSITQLLKAYQLDTTNFQILGYIALSYQNLGNQHLSEKYLNLLQLKQNR
jgi:protein O-mannosyl-transferase